MEGQPSYTLQVRCAVSLVHAKVVTCRSLTSPVAIFALMGMHRLQIANSMHLMLVSLFGVLHARHPTLRQAGNARVQNFGINAHCIFLPSPMAKVPALVPKFVNTVARSAHLPPPPMLPRSVWQGWSPASPQGHVWAQPLPRDSRMWSSRNPLLQDRHVPREAVAARPRAQPNIHSCPV